MMKKILVIVTLVFSITGSLIVSIPALADSRLQAEEALAAGDAELALQHYLELLALEPGDRDALEIAMILAQEIGVPEMAVELLLGNIEFAVSQSETGTVQADLVRMTELQSALPDWIETKFVAASAVTEAQMSDFEVWQELKEETDVMMDAGEFETAATLLDGVLILAQDSFGEDHWATIAAMRDLGLVQRQLGMVEEADAYYNAAFDASAGVLGVAHPKTQHIAELIAELYSATGAPEEAHGMRELIIAHYEDELGAAHALTMAARLNQVATFETIGSLDDATEVLAEICGTYADNYSDYHPDTISCLLSLARLQKDTGSLDEAEVMLQTVVANLAESTSRISAAGLNALMQLAEIYREQGEYQAAKDLLSGLINVAQQIGETDTIYTGKSYLARILANQGETDNARVLTESVVDYGRDAWGDRPIQYYNVFIELGAIYQQQSRLREAETIFEDSMMALLEIVGEAHPSTLVAMNNLGYVYEQQGLYDEAEPMLKQSLAGMESVFGPDHPQTARTRNNLALLHESQGNFREAEPLYHTSYEYLTAAHSEQYPDAIAVRNNLAFLYMMMEDYDTSAAMFEEIVANWAIVLGPDHQNSLKSLNNLGRVYQRQGRFDEAEQKVVQALYARRENLGEKHIDTIRSMIDLGAIYLDQGRLDEAAQELRAALTVAEEVIGEQHPYTFEALNNLAKVTEAQGDLSGAVELREMGLGRRSEFLDRMLWVSGENAREGYIRLHRPELDDYLSLLTRVKDPERGKKAIEASLQRKGLLLKITSEIEQIAQLSVDPKLRIVSTELENARKELAALTLSGPTAETQGRHTEFLYQLERRVNELQGELGRASVRYRSSIAGVDADSIASSLEENSALVDFLMYDDEGTKSLLAGVIVNDRGEIRYELVEFPDRAAVEASVIEYRSIIQDDLADEDEIIEIGQIAHDLIWLPVQEAVGDLEYVYLVPDGILNILPFNALMNNDEEYLIQTTDLHILTSGRDLLPNEYRLAEGQYVIIAGPDYNFDEIVSTSDLAEAQGRRSAALKLGIRGAGGGLRGLSFAPLPGAEREGRIITDRVEANEEASEVYFGEDAQEQVLANFSEAPEVLHIATHGFFLEADDTLRKRLLKLQRGGELQVPPPGDNPLLRAGLAFAGINSNAQFLGDIDTVNDGVLTALEVLGLNLSGTRLVVLSACETGLGEIHEGEGVYGLRRAFQEAGVAEVISSLWEVSDDGTQALMTDFYDRLLAGIPARTALRDTQLAMLDSPEWGYPYIWSAFMIVGSYESAGISLQ